MSITSVTRGTDTGATDTSNVSLTSAMNGQGMGKNDFIKLLLTQLQHQDPTNPMDNTAFVAQLAQFTSLEQMTNLNESFQNLSNLQVVNQATGLIGKTVTLTDTDGNEVTGKVEKVTLHGGLPRVVIDKKEYDVANIKEIK